MRLTGSQLCHEHPAHGRALSVHCVLEGPGLTLTCTLGLRRRAPLLQSSTLPQSGMHESAPTHPVVNETG